MPRKFGFATLDIPNAAQSTPFKTNTDAASHSNSQRVNMYGQIALERSVSSSVIAPLYRFQAVPGGAHFDMHHISTRSKIGKHVFPASINTDITARTKYVCWNGDMFASSRLMPELLKAEIALKEPSHHEFTWFAAGISGVCAVM